MSVVVAYKYARNPADASVAPDGAIDWSRARPAISDDDPVALELGRRVAAASDVELVGVSVGGVAAGTPLARKAAAARGPSRLLLTADDAVLDWGPAHVVAALAALVRRVPAADLVLTGDASVDEGAGIVPPLLAAHLGWLCLADVTAVERAGSGWRVTQACADGVRTVSTAGPLVASVASDAVPAPVPGMRALLAAASAPCEIVPVAALPAGPAPRLLGRSRRDARPRLQRRFSGPRAAADLVAALRADGVLS